MSGAADQVSVIVSNSVPAGAQWAIGGTWSFGVYVNNSARDGVAADLRATVYRVATDGTLTSLATANLNNTSLNTGFALRTWNGTVPANTLTAGQRFGVRFEVRDQDGRGGSANLRLNNAAAESTVSRTLPAAG